ncbi:MAG: Gfo/Idh/MocA family oxidoreductase [Candidatus Sumerlaeota bacterium]|nr:Gfo/Idh/MocA family oxidoreductase [Candidatus Sumerlaeota bacterium]
MRKSVESTRRQFLKGAALAAAGAVAAPMFIPSSALGKDGATAPSNRITVGCVGIGKQMVGHVNGFAGDPDWKVLALCDVEKDRLERGRKLVTDKYDQRMGKGNYKGPDTYGDFRELIARADIDSVAIATPDHWHALISVAAMKAGKDVYCEKPLAHNISEARAIADAAKRYNRVFQTGSMQRSDRTFRFACELAINGRLGKVHTIHVNVGGPPQTCNLPAQECPKTLDWDMWLGPAPYRPYNEVLCPFDDWKTFPGWRGFREYGGGGMTDWGAHHFDIAQWGLGMDKTGPVDIIPPDLSVSKMLTYKYANGVVMTHGGAEGKSGTQFIGLEGSVGVNRGNFLLCKPESLAKEIIGPDEIHLYESREHRENWKQCIRTRRETICTAETGCRTVTVCHLGNIAYQLGRQLKWDPEKEVFIGDDEANRLLRRPMREPWEL